MKIEQIDNDHKVISILDIKPGDCFLFRGHIYFAIINNPDSEFFDAVDLRDGVTISISKYERVNLVDATLQWKHLQD